MLSDIESKVMRIIENDVRMKDRTPTIAELMQRTGRLKNGIMQILQKLNDEKLIQWDRNEPEKILLRQIFFATRNRWRDIN
jgi:SOS-response transcriptional repressor LexA